MQVKKTENENLTPMKQKTKEEKTFFVKVYNTLVYICVCVCVCDKKEEDRYVFVLDSK
jgi:hypothetical protein